MSKKDRIAIVVSVVLGLLGTLLLNGGGIVGVPLGVLILILIPAYWAYRFIKNDISFIKIKE